MIEVSLFEILILIILSVLYWSQHVMFMLCDNDNVTDADISRPGLKLIFVNNILNNIAAS